MKTKKFESRKSPKAVIHVDLDGASHIYQSHGWRYEYKEDILFESGLKNLLAFLDNNKLRATLFTIASDLDDPDKCKLLKEALFQGHEIASHSLTHPRFDLLSRDEKRIEIAKSREKLEALLDTPVKGFRVPNYQVDRDCLELLDECGYSYDSSVFPTLDFAKRLKTQNILGGPHRPLYDRPIIEFPLPSYKPAPLPFHPSYSLIIGTYYFKWGLGRFRKTGLPLVLLFHLADFAEPLHLGRIRDFRSKIYTLSHLPAEVKLKRCQVMIDQVKQEYQLTDTVRLLTEQADYSMVRKPLILAISTTHETGTALFEGSNLKAAISEERLDRVKLSTNYPPVRSIKEVIRIAGIAPKEIQHVVISGLQAKQLLPQLMRGQFRDFVEFHGWNDYFPHFNKLLYRSFYFYRALKYKSILSFLRKEYGIHPNIYFIEHHLCHASAVYRTAPFDEALIVTADGVGDDISLTISVGRKGRIERLRSIIYPHSFGQFYTACTQILGFSGGRHEGKITGLSSFGTLDHKLYERVKSTIRSSGPDFALDKRYYSEGIIRGLSIRKILGGEGLFDALQYRNYKMPLKKLLQGYSREDVAAAFQKILEEEIEAVVRPYVKKTRIKNLAISGGVFANVKLNDSLFKNLRMEQVYIFPAMGDGGLSVGAALEFLQTRPKPFDTVYWGSEYSVEELEKALFTARAEGLSYRYEENIEKTVAELLAKDKVIARFNGRMEFGPRALGNRSIVYNARDSKANDWLNKKLHRTEFMPFAPVVMAEKARNLFNGLKGKEHACKFMTIIVECNDWTKKHCPAIVHVDGTARPQLVTKEINPSMYSILSYYESLTGIPLIVNTSFNMHEEPIVCTPDDAVRAYIASRLDYLAIGPFLAWL